MEHLRRRRRQPKKVTNTEPRNTRSLTAAQGHQMPMVQVMGPEGQPCHVFRPWTEADMMGTLAFLPSLEASGEKFPEALDTFCREFCPTFPELRRLLSLKIGSVAYAKIKEKLGPDVKMVSPVWTDEQNRPYVLAVQGLIEHIKVKFPRKCDTTSVAKCKQETGESVDKCLNRLTEVYNEFSGVTPPSEIAAVSGPWEQGLINAFRNGLLPQIAKAVNKSCVGIEDARLTEVRRHAAHAERLLREAGEMEDKKMKRDNHKASLTMMRHFAAGSSDTMRRSYRDNDNWRRAAGGERTGRNVQGACHNCGRMGHWAKECREKDRRDRQNQVEATEGRRWSGGHGMDPARRSLGLQRFRREVMHTHTCKCLLSPLTSLPLLTPTLIQILMLSPLTHTLTHVLMLIIPKRILIYMLMLIFVLTMI